MRNSFVLLCALVLGWFFTAPARAQGDQSLEGVKQAVAEFMLAGYAGDVSRFNKLLDPAVESDSQGVYQRILKLHAASAKVVLRAKDRFGQDVAEKVAERIAGSVNPLHEQYVGTLEEARRRIDENAEIYFNSDDSKAIVVLPGSGHPLVEEIRLRRFGANRWKILLPPQDAERLPLHPHMHEQLLTGFDRMLQQIEESKDAESFLDWLKNEGPQIVIPQQMLRNLKF